MCLPGPYTLLDEERHQKEAEIGEQAAGGALRIRSRQKMQRNEGDEERHGADREPRAAERVPGPPGQYQAKRGENGQENCTW